MPDAWKPDQYERFKAQRRQPFDDLKALVTVWQARLGMSKPRVLDLGCGTGHLTAELHEGTGATQTLGIDSSDSMLARAPQGIDNLTFQTSDIAAFSSDHQWDIVFSNAALHWLPDHERLIAQVAGHVAPGGLLAVQVPANHDHPSQTIAADLAQEEPFSAALGGFYRQSPVLLPEEYARLLFRLGFPDQLTRLNVYGHELDGPEHVIEWVKGTTLTDYEKRLSPKDYAAFIAEYSQRLLAVLGDDNPHFFPFKRILFIAQKPA